MSPGNAIVDASQIAASRLRRLAGMPDCREIAQRRKAIKLVVTSVISHVPGSHHDLIQRKLLLWWHPLNHFKHPESHENRPT